MQRSKRYLAEIASALKPVARGRKACSGRLLSEEQEAALRQIICDKRPEPRKMAFALWNRVGVMQRIEPDCDIKLSVRNDSPELNPEERFNANLKQAIYTKVPVYTKAKLKVVATAYMQLLEKSSSRMQNRVQKFFQDARVK